MLYASFGLTSVEWHIGESTGDINNRAKDTPELVLLVQADGDELYHIQTTFEGIPFCKNVRVQSWRGEFARFILDNLTE